MAKRSRLLGLGMGLPSAIMMAIGNMQIVIIANEEYRYSLCVLHECSTYNNSDTSKGGVPSSLRYFWHFLLLFSIDDGEQTTATLLNTVKHDRSIKRLPIQECCFSVSMGNATTIQQRTGISLQQQHRELQDIVSFSISKPYSSRSICQTHTLRPGQQP